MRSKQHPSQIRLKELFDYHDGKLIWRIRKCKSIPVGTEAGTLCKTNGRWQISIDNTLYLRSRLVWIWHNGEIPDELVVDHKDNVRTNDIITNLQPITSTNNNRKIGRRARRHNLPKNVYNNRKGYAVQFNGKCFGTYSTIEEATLVAQSKGHELYGDFYNNKDVCYSNV